MVHKRACYTHQGCGQPSGPRAGGLLTCARCPIVSFRVYNLRHVFWCLGYIRSAGSHLHSAVEQIKDNGIYECQCVLPLAMKTGRSVFFESAPVDVDQIERGNYAYGLKVQVERPWML